MTGPASDSAGTPWNGRTLPAGGFAGDDGGTDAALRAALEGLAAGTASAGDVVEALTSARLLVPVVAVREAEEQTVHGTSDTQADMALVTLTGPDGRRALPVFSSVAALAAWDPAARPVPTDCRRAAVSAVAEGCDVMVLDAAGPSTFVLSRSALWAVGQGRRWLPAHEDPDVLAELAAVAATEPDVTSLRGEPGRQTQLALVLAVRPGLDGVGLRDLAERVSAVLRASEVVRERVDGLELRVTTG